MVLLNFSVSNGYELLKKFGMSWLIDDVKKLQPNRVAAFKFFVGNFFKP